MFQSQRTFAHGMVTDKPVFLIPSFFFLQIDKMFDTENGNLESLKQKKDDLLIQAVELYEQVGPGIDLGGVIYRLRTVGCTWGAIYLCLHAARARDPEDFAYACLKEGLRPRIASEVSAIEGR